MTIITLAFLLSVTAFATPFDSFEGEYSTSGNPSITANQMKECNWVNFKGITGVVISKNAQGFQTLDVLSIMSNAPLKVGFELKEYNFSGPFGVSNIGKFEGTEGRAQYQQINSTPDFREVSTWEISATPSGYSFYMAYQVRDQFGVNGSCFYSVPFSKK